MNPYCYGPATCSVGANDHIVYNAAQLGASVDSWTLNDGVSSLRSSLGSLKLTITCRFLGDGTACRKVILHHNPSLCPWARTNAAISHFSPSFVKFVEPTLGAGHTIISAKIVEMTFHSTANACNSELLSAKTGRSASAWGTGQDLMGDTIFIRTDCSNREPLPMDKQNPAYCHPGVAMPHGIREAYTSFWSQQKAVSSLAIDPAKIGCVAGDGALHVDDCIGALQNMIGDPGNSINSSSAGDKGEGYTTLAVG